MRPQTLLGLSVLSALSVAPARAQSIHDYLPASTMAVISVPDLVGSMERFQSMPLAKMWHEDEVQEFIGDLMDMANSQWDQMMAQGRQMHENGDLPVSPDELMKLRMMGGTFAVTQFSIGMSEWGEPIPDIGIVLQLDFGDSADAWFKLINMGTGLIEQEAGDDLVKSTFDVGGTSLTTWAPANDEVPFSLNIARVGNTLVFGTKTDELAGILQALASQTPKLSASPAFRAANGPLGIAQPEMTAFVQVQPIIDMVLGAVRVIVEAEGAPIDVDGVARAIDAMGFNSIKSSASASAYQNGECVTKSYTVSPAPERKGFFGGSAKILDMDFLRWVPKDAVSVSATTMDVTTMYDALVGGMRAYDNDLAEQMLGALADYEKELGISVKEDLFGAFGDQFVTWSMPMVAMGSPPEMAFLFKVKDEKRLLETLGTLTQLSEGMVELDAVNRRGIEAHQIRVNMDMGNMMMNPFDMFVPTFSFKDGYMVMGFSAGDVKRVFDRMDREDDPKGDIRGNAEVAALMGRLPEAGVTSVSFTDWKASFEGLYQMVTGVLAFVPMDQDIPVDLALLPESTTLTQHLSGGMSYTVADGNGYTTVAHAPFGPEILIGVAVAAGAAAGFAATIR